MITPEDVKMQLMALLPRYTDEFCDCVKGSFAIVASGEVRVTSVGHGLANGDTIVGSDISVIVPISDVTFNSSTNDATITTAFEHDITSGERDNGGYNQAALQDFEDSEYNGSFTAKSATRTTFVIDASADVVGAYGNLIETRSLFLGFLPVTVVDENTFTVPLADPLLAEGAVFETFEYTANQRIFISADITRAVTAYAQRRNVTPALFIIFGAETASKDRNTINDSVTSATSQNLLYLMYILEMHFVTMATTKTEHSAATKQQLIYSTIRGALRKAAYGHIFEDTESLKVYAAHEISNMPIRYNTGYYMHQFTYAVPYVISIEQGVTAQSNVSFRDIIVNSRIFKTEGALASLETKLEI